MPPRSMQGKLRIAARLLAIDLGLLVLTALLLEAGVRLFSPQTLRRDPTGAFVPFGPFYRPRPGFEARASRPDGVTTWKINTHGMRGPEVGYDKPAATRRILGLGDSFTFGYTVDEPETYLRRLEAELNAPPPDATRATDRRRFEVLNMGAGGCGTVAEQALFDLEGCRYAPDVVLLGFFVGNDVQDALRESRSLRATSVPAPPVATALKPKPAVPKPDATFGYRLRRHLGENLQLYSFVSRRAHELLVRLGIRKIDQDTITILSRDESPEIRAGWGVVEEALLALQTSVQRDSARLYVVLIPVRHQVNRDEWPFLCKTYRLRPEKYELERPQRILRELCARHGISCLDLLPDLRQEHAPCYNLGEDAHWNAHGHQVAARRIAAYLRHHDLSG